MGLTMSANIAAKLLKVYDKLSFKRKILWCDSKNVLAWCSTPVNKVNFVHNRVSTIRNLCPEFEIRYVKSNENPADLITKPIKGEAFIKERLWWKGPQWLAYPNTWDMENEYNLHPEGAEIELEYDIPNLKELEISTLYGNMVAVQRNDENTKQLKSAKDILWNFDHYKSLIKFYSGLAVLISCMKNKNPESLKPYEGTLNKYNIGNPRAEGEKLAIKTMQRECFPEEIKILENGGQVKKNEFCQLKLYLDQYGIIRIQGRLRDEHFTNINKPILFGYRHPLTILLILNHHRCCNCSGVNYTLNKVRKDIHSPKLRRQIREVINKCLICRRLLSRPFKYPEHPPINFFRTNGLKPFLMCGVDYIGPFPIYQSQEQISDSPEGKPKEAKAWIVLFSCLVSRAIYTVLVPDRKTETFLAAFREVSSRRCEPRMMLSDNEGSFLAANKVLQKIAESSKVKNKFKQKGIQWKFLPSRASWMGGVYERLVQLVKIELMKMQRKAKFNETEWRSHLVDIEQILNDRPLTYVTDNPLEPEIITPNSIMHGCISETNLANSINTDEAIIEMRQYQNNPVSVYKERVKVKQQFWDKLNEEYIASLNISSYKKNKSKGRYSRIVPEVGQVVAIQDHETKLGGRLAYIVRLIPTENDTEIRQVEVKTTIPSRNIDLNKNFRTETKIKAVSHLIPLELKVDDFNPLELQQTNQTVNQSDHPTLNSNKQMSQTRSQSLDGGNSLSEKMHRTSDVWDTGHEARTSDDTENPNQEDLINLSQIVTEDTGAKCGAPRCSNPEPQPGELLKWVECDERKCKAWYHFKCAGIPYELFDEMEERKFFCDDCKKNDFSGFSSQHTGVSQTPQQESPNLIRQRPKRISAQKCEENLKIWTK